MTITGTFNEPYNSRPNTAAPRNGLSVLVVDDHEDTATTMAMLLNLYGHEARVAVDGPAALHAVAVNPPDVVLLDIGMPGMSGYEVAERLAQPPSHGQKRPLLIAVTGYGQEEDRRHSAEAGIDLHLLKPVDPKDLLPLLDRFRSVLGGV